MYDAKNEIITTLSAEFVHGTDVTAVLTSVTGFPTTGGYIRISGVLTDGEWVLYEYTGISSNTLTGLTACILGNVESTAAHTFAAASTVELILTAEYIENLKGASSFPEDGGAVTAADMAVSATPIAGTEESYAFKIDGTTIAKVYAEADGVGGIQNPRFEAGEIRVTNDFEVGGRVALGNWHDIMTEVAVDMKHSWDEPDEGKQGLHVAPRIKVTVAPNTDGPALIAGRFYPVLHEDNTQNLTGTPSMVGASVTAADLRTTGNAYTVDSAYGLWVRDLQFLGAGTVTTHHGIHISDLTLGGTTNIGLYIAGASTYAIHVDSGLSRFDGRVFLDPGNAAGPACGLESAATGIYFPSGGMGFSFAGSGYALGERAAGVPYFTNPASGESLALEFFTADGDGTDVNQACWWNVGTPASVVNSERLTIGWEGNNNLRIQSEALGTGTLRPINFEMNPGAGPTIAVMTIGTLGNVGLGATTWGTNAVRSLAIANGTAPTSSIAGQIELFSVDISAAATLGLRTEAAVVVEVDETKFSHKHPVKINGADYFIMLTAT